MTYLFADQHVQALGRLVAGARVLVGFDFDGTLAPIVDDPDCARLRPFTQALLESVTSSFPCVVISGRARADVLARLGRADLRCVVGNHGLEWESPLAGAKRAARLVRRWQAELTLQLAIYGAAIENKRYSLAVHWRRAPRRAEAARAARKAAAALRDAQVIGGKQVLNILPAGSPTKADALVRAQALLGCDAALYVGDDLTDEAVFERGAQEGWVTVRVGRSRSSTAAHFLRGQHEIDKLLALLLCLRPPAHRRRTQGRR